MKKSDIALIVIIAAIGATVAYFAAGAIFGNTKNRTQTVKTIDEISSDQISVDKTIFNSNSINPSVPVEVQGGSDSDIAE